MDRGWIIILNLCVYIVNISYDSCICGCWYVLEMCPSVLTKPCKITLARPMGKTPHLGPMGEPIGPPWVSHISACNLAPIWFVISSTFWEFLKWLKLFYVTSAWNYKGILYHPTFKVPSHEVPLVLYLEVK